MARRESDREDLLREATALVERVELIGSRSPFSQPVTAGFRAGGEFSVFLGNDTAYQFNELGQLRRAFCDGLLFKAIGGRLASLRRVRQQNKVELLRHDLSDSEQSAFMQRMRNILGDLRLGLERGEFCVAGQVPANADVGTRLQDWLAHHDGETIAASPHARPRR